MAIDAKLIIFIFNFLLKDNCFTEFCCFLSNVNMNQPAVQLVHSFSRVQLFAAPWTQHTRPLCPSPTPGVHPNSCPSSRWCHPAISSCIVPFSSCPQYLPASESFPMNQLFSWGGQSIGVSALASVLPMNTQDWSYLGINNLRVLAFAAGLLVSEKINKSIHLSLSSFPTPCRHMRTKDVLSITLACYTPLITNPEVREFGFSVKMRVAMTTSWCLALHGRVFWTGLCKACLLDRDPPGELVPFVPSKHHTNIN